MKLNSKLVFLTITLLITSHQQSYSQLAIPQFIQMEETSEIGVTDARPWSKILADPDWKKIPVVRQQQYFASWLRVVATHALKRKEPRQQIEERLNIATGKFLQTVVSTPQDAIQFAQTHSASIVYQDAFDNRVAEAWEVSKSAFPQLSDSKSFLSRLVNSYLAFMRAEDAHYCDSSIWPFVHVQTCNAMLASSKGKEEELLSVLQGVMQNTSRKSVSPGVNDKQLQELERIRRELEHLNLDRQIEKNERGFESLKR